MAVMVAVVVAIAAAAAADEHNRGSNSKRRCKKHTCRLNIEVIKCKTANRPGDAGNARGKFIQNVGKVSKWCCAVGCKEHNYPRQILNSYTHCEETASCCVSNVPSPYKKNSTCGKE